MKREQRQPYLDLINMMPGGYGLCHFCRYAEWSGCSCCDADLDCKHGLAGDWKFPEPDNVWQGGDCWGFRPSETLQEIGVAVSIMLAGYNAHKSFSQGEYIAIKPSINDAKEGLVGVFV